MRRFLILLGVVSVGLLAVGQAQAVTLFQTGTIGGDPAAELIGAHVTSADVGESFAIDWVVDGSVTGGEVISGNSLWTVESYSDDQILLTISVENTSVLTPTLSNSAILSLGFGVEPDATGEIFAGSVFDVVGDGNGPNQTYPGGFTGIDICVFSAGCSGGSINSGLQAGEMDTFQILLTSEDSAAFADGTDLLFFGAKFQTAIGSFEPGGQPIPEPTSAMLFLVGALVVGRSVRRS